MASSAAPISRLVGGVTKRQRWSWRSWRRCRCGVAIQKLSSQSWNARWRRGAGATAAEGPQSGEGFGKSDVSTSEASDIAATDQLIDKLLNASESELPQLVAQNVFSLDTSFYMRLATRADTAEDEGKRDNLHSLANTVMKLTEQMVEQAEGEMDTSAVTLQSVLAAASDDADGEFYVPLTDTNVQRLRERIEHKFDEIGEGVMSTAFAWMRKSQEQQMEGMVAIIQRMLQIYGGVALAKSLEQANEANGSQSDASVALCKVLRSDVERWPDELAHVEHAGLQEGFLTEIERLMQEVVTALPKGSQEQRVRAEVLKELEERARRQWVGYEPVSTSSPSTS